MLYIAHFCFCIGQCSHNVMQSCNRVVLSQPQSKYFFMPSPNQTLRNLTSTTVQLNRRLWHGAKDMVVSFPNKQYELAVAVTSTIHGRSVEIVEGYRPLGTIYDHQFKFGGEPQEMPADSIFCGSSARLESVRTSFILLILHRVFSHSLSRAGFTPSASTGTTHRAQ